ncbi:MAG: hypothetical protein GY938_12955 [Ketobacter sp.]|nr:hypothetical protein [Ketobacter sp.]
MKKVLAARSKFYYDTNGKQRHEIGSVLILEGEGLKHLRDRARVVGPLNITPLSVDSKAPGVCKEIPGKGYIVSKGGGWYITCDLDYTLINDNVQGWKNALKFNKSKHVVEDVAEYKADIPVE